MNQVLSIGGLCVGLIGLAYAIYANREKNKAEKFLRAAGWDLYNKASNQNAFVQKALAVLITNDCPRETLDHLSKADAFGQYLTRDSIKLIHHVEPTFNEEIIKKWVDSERVFAGHKELFMALTPSKDTKYKHRTIETNKANH